MRLSILLLAAVMPMVLSSCAVVDIVAHSVKEIDKSQTRGAAQPAATRTEVQPAAVVRDEEPPAPIYSGPSGPSRGSVQVEELPPVK